MAITVGLGGELCSLLPAARARSENASTTPRIRELGCKKPNPEHPKANPGQSFKTIRLGVRDMLFHMSSWNAKRLQVPGQAA